jgi:YegS/Rv2252/BmrU family lipid kinase
MTTDRPGTFAIAGVPNPPQRTSARRIRVLINPDAGSKAGLPTNRTSEDDIRKVMARFDLGTDLVVTTSINHARDLTRDALAHQYDAVIAAGGDGTARVVARELLHSRTALGILPLGSVMNIARMLEIPRDLEAAAQVIVDGDVRKIDVGQAGDVTFFESASVGLNAPVFAALQRFDAGAYHSIFHAIWIALRYRPARMVIHLDDRTIRTRALMVTIANGPYTGMALTVAPDAQLNDGRFDVSLFRRFSRLGLFGHLIRTAFGRQRYSPKVDTYRSASVRIESVSPLPTRADSEDLGSTPITLRVTPAALRVIAPGTDE